MDQEAKVGVDAEVDATEQGCGGVIRIWHSIASFGIKTPVLAE